MELDLKINDFEGPLDLLLHLIKENKMDIFDIKIEVIAEQYLSYLEKQESMNLEIASEYLVMAAELVELKSKLLLPSQSIDCEEEIVEDCRDDLVNRLLEYEAYKKITETLKKQEEIRQEIYTKNPSDVSNYIEDDNNIDGVLLLLNTMGGDVESGLAIAEMIASMSKPTVSLVLGGGHSIGVPLAVAPMVTMIAPSASMTIHPVRTSGTIIAAPQTYQYFERLQERIVRFVTKNSRIERDVFLRLMMDTQDLASDVGSVLYGEEAVACGLIQRLGSLSDALEALYALIDEKKK